MVRLFKLAYLLGLAAVRNEGIVIGRLVSSVKPFFHGKNII